MWNSNKRGPIMHKKTVQELEKAALEIRKGLLEICSKEIIHIGGDLSLADIMTVLWQYQIRYDPKNIRDEKRDRFVLSKGHASAVMCLNQAAIGCFPKEDVIGEYASDSGRFSMHSCNLVNPYVEVSTGSLGHGFPIACGMAQALRMKNNRNSRVYVVMGDGEQSEGSVWEAAINSIHYRLGNLVAIIDGNELEADGRIDELTALGNIAEKYESFGWRVKELDGNDISALVYEFDALPDADSEIPTLFMCHTIKGKGVAFMEKEHRWHTGKITDKQKNDAIAELEQAFCRKWGLL